MASVSETTVVNVKVKFIRPQGYNNLKEWMKDDQNIYIGRKGVLLLKDESGKSKRFPPEASPWANPYKVGKDGTRAEVIKKYTRYIKEKIDSGELDLETLRNHRLGCWCKPEPCHGDILKELLEEKSD